MSLGGTTERRLYQWREVWSRSSGREAAERRRREQRRCDRRTWHQRHIAGVYGTGPTYGVYGETCRQRRRLRTTSGDRVAPGSTATDSSGVYGRSIETAGGSSSRSPRASFTFAQGAQTFPHRHGR